MRPNLGKRVILLFVLFASTLYATSYEWHLKSNKENVYVNEAIEIEYTCIFEDQANLYVIEFAPEVKKNSAYRIFSLGVVEKIIDGRLQ